MPQQALPNIYNLLNRCTWNLKFSKLPGYLSPSLSLYAKLVFSRIFSHLGLDSSSSPSFRPGFFVGFRLALVGSWMALIVVETINATSGIGYMMSQAQLYAQSDVILVGLVVYGIFGFTSDALVRLLERRVLSWRRTLAS